MRGAEKYDPRGPPLTETLELPFLGDMTLGSISAAASAGTASAADRLERVAARNASQDGDAVGVVGEASGARVQLAASVAVARAANEMLGTLLDILA